MVGKQILNYRITRLIGKGGMSHVYEAEHIRLGHKVAVKVLNEEHAGNPNIRERFINEARIMAGFDHPHIAKVIDLDENAKEPAIVMELVKGKTLAEYMKSRKGLNVKEALDIMEVLLKTFAYAHQRGIVHRDVKPANVIMDTEKSDHIKILDFGIAKMIHSDANLTSTGMQMGTPLYMSPEQVEESKDIDRRSDVYSLGVLFYYLLSGKPPYDHTNLSNFKVFVKIVQEPLPELEVSAPLNRIIQKATAKNPADRFQSCEEFLAGLNNLKDFRQQPETPDMPEDAREHQKPLHDNTTGNDNFREKAKENGLNMKTNVIFNVKTDTCSISDTGLIRKENEDNMGYAATPNGDVFVICDGLGGHAGGKVASSVAVESIVDYFSREKKENVYHAIDEAIRYANQKIIEKAREEPALEGMGTAIVLTVIQEDKTYIAHVGDSRIYLFSDNCLYRVTTDHSLVQQMVDSGMLTPEEAETHPKKNIISRALGITENVDPEIAQDPLLLKNGDVLLMCTDGLSDMLDDQTIHSVLMKHDNVRNAGDELLKLALEAGGKDNITFHLIKITKSNHKESVFVDKSYKPVC